MVSCQFNLAVGLRQGEGCVTSAKWLLDIGQVSRLKETVKYNTGSIVWLLVLSLFLAGICISSTSPLPDTRTPTTYAWNSPVHSQTSAFPLTSLFCDILSAYIAVCLPNARYVDSHCWYVSIPTHCQTIAFTLLVCQPTAYPLPGICVLIASMSAYLSDIGIPHC